MNLVERVGGIPITPPVDFISRSSQGSLPVRRSNGRTTSVTLVCSGGPAWVATFAVGTPVAFETIDRPWINGQLLV